MSKDYGAKSYKLLIMWLFGFLICMIAGSIVTITYFSEASLKVNFLLVLLALLTLLYMIYKTENVYWINGTSYTDAKYATSEMRKKFAMSHLKVFIKATVIYSAYLIMSVIVNTSMVIDIIFFLTLIIVAAIKTIPIKL